MSNCNTPRRNTFDYTVWYRDPKNSENDKMIESNRVEAIDDKHAERIALRNLSEEWDDKIQNIEVIVRPF